MLVYMGLYVHMYEDIFKSIYKFMLIWVDQTIKKFSQFLLF